jgi:hypothetical protein
MKILIILLALTLSTLLHGQTVNPEGEKTILVTYQTINSAQHISIHYGGEKFSHEKYDRNELGLNKIIEILNDFKKKGYIINHFSNAYSGAGVRIDYLLELKE